MLLSALSALGWVRISFEAISHQPSHRQCASSARRPLRWVLCIPRTRKSGGQFVGKRILQEDDGRGGAGEGGVGELVLVGSSLRTDWCGFRISAGFYIQRFRLVTNRISKSCSIESKLDYLWTGNIALYSTSTTSQIVQVARLFGSQPHHLAATFRQNYLLNIFKSPKLPGLLLLEEVETPILPGFLAVSEEYLRAENRPLVTVHYIQTDRNAWQTSISVKDVSSPHFHPCCRG